MVGYGTGEPNPFLESANQAISQYGAYKGPATTTEKAAPLPKAPGIGSQIVHQLGTLGQQAVGAVGHALVDPVMKFGGTIGALASGKDFKAAQDQTRATLEMRVKMLSKQYASTDSNVKISKETFDRQMKQIQKEYGDLNNQADEYGKQLQSPLEAVKSGAETLALPFAAPAKEGEGVLGAAKALATVPIKNALVTQPLVDLPFQTVKDVKTGNYKDIAANAAFLGGGAALMKVPAIAKKIGEGVFGTKGVLSEVFGPRVEQFLKDRPEFTPIAKQMQQFTLNHKGGSHEDAAQFLIKHLEDNKVLPVGSSPKDAELYKVFGNADSYYRDRLRLDSAAGAARKAGTKLPSGPLVLAHSAKGVRGSFVTRLTSAEKEGKFSFTADPATKQTQVQDFIAHQMGHVKDQTLLNQFGDAALNANSRAEFKNAITEIKDRPGLTVPGYRAPKGMVVVKGPHGTTRVPKAEQSGDLKFSKPGSPLFKGAVDKLTRAGLSPIDQGDETAKGLLRDAFVKRLGGTDLPEAPSQAYNNLFKVAGEQKAFDPRSLTAFEVKRGMGAEYSTDQAKTLIKSLKQSYSDLPAQYTGLGGKVLNKAIEKTPGMAQYLRIENIGRFQANPFFQAKRAVKGALLTEAEGGSVFKRGSDDTMKTLEQNGFFSRALRDQGVEDLAQANIGKNVGSLGRIDRHLVGSLAQSLADAQGKSVGDILKGPHSDEFATALRTVVGYPKGYLSSPFAKTLNVVTFPSRFNAKVLLAAGHWLSHQTPATRVGLLVSMSHFKQFLDSDAGVKWQSQNAATLGILNYYSPTHTIGAVFKAIDQGDPSDLGQIGGLPFGIITTLLKHQGIVGDSAYQDPATGKVYDRSLPANGKARAQQAFADILGSMFSYPGRQSGFGLSKGDLVQGIPGLKKNPADYKNVPVEPSPEQKRVQNILAPTKKPALSTNSSGEVRPINLTPTSVSKIKIAPLGKVVKPKKGRTKYVARPI